MLTQLDEKFQAALDDDTKLEEQLVRLANQRYWSTIAATALAAYIFAHAFFVLFTYRSSISARTPVGLNVPPGMVLMPLIFLILMLQWAVKAVVTHCEIRVLLTFKKLRDVRQRD
ncbi:MAG: hypothetical protein V4819_04425 [Verrucomicrobiota bacterium]